MKSLSGILSAACLALGLALTGLPAGAQQPKPPSAAAIAAAKEILAMKKASTMYAAAVPNIVQQTKDQLLQSNLNYQKDLNEVAAKLRTDLQPRFVEITNEVALLYAQNFSEQELKEILAFYKTPAGQKLLKTQPKVIDSSMAFAQTWANKLSDEVIAKMREELKKKGHNL